MTKAIEILNDLSDVDSHLDEGDKKLISIFDLILEINEENLESVFNTIKKYGQKIQHITNFIFISMKIRPKQCQSLINLFKLINKEFTVKSEMARPGFDKIIENTATKEEIDMFLNLYKPNTIERAIYEDDIESFIKFATSPSFNAKSKYRLLPDEHYTNYTCMDLISIFGSIKCFKYAINSGEFDYKSAVSYAVAGGNKEIIKLLENKGCTFDNCLDSAYTYHRKEISNWLLEHYDCKEVDLENVISYFNYRALYFHFVNVFDDEYVDENIDEFKDFIDTKNVEAFRFIKKYSGVDFSSYDSGRRLLNAAVKNNSFDIAKFLVKECNVDVDETKEEVFTEEEEEETDFCGTGSLKTALTKAIRRGSIEEVKFLIEECNASTEACETEESRTSSGFGPYQETRSYKSPLFIAIKENNIDIIKYLVLKGKSDVNGVFTKSISNYDKNNRPEDFKEEKRTALHVAIEKSGFEVIKFLIEEGGADLNINYRIYKHENIYEEYTPLQLAIEHDDFETVKYLCEVCNVDVNERGRMVEDQVMPITALSLAEMENNEKITKYLKKNFDAESVDESEFYEEEENYEDYYY